MAPEILTRQPITSACDVFSLGVVLAFARGIRPFGEGPSEAIDYRVVHEEPNLQGLDLPISGLVAECLAKKPSDRPTPTQILERLGDYGSVARWLPEPVYDMITACAPPHGPTVVRANPLDYSRLLAEAEQIARALTDEYERAVGLIHIARVVCHDDPPHAARLLDDARYPTKHAPEVASQWRRPLMEYLIESSAAEVGTVMAHIDANAADQVLADIAAYSNLLTHRHMGVEEEAAKVIATIAEAAAEANPDRAERISRILTNQSWQAVAVARVAMAVAHTDSARAEQMIRTITTRIEQMMPPMAGQAGVGRVTRRWRRERVSADLSVAVPFDYDTARYWAAQALAELAVGVTGAYRVRVGRRPTDADYFARTVTSVGDLGTQRMGPIRMAGIDLARAAQYLAHAEDLASRIAASSFTASGTATADLRAGALAAVKTAAAQIDPEHADALLAEAEQNARAIADDSERLESLGQVAMAAARIDPARAEQVARSLLHLPHKLGELALVVSISDTARGERIAAAITDDYLRALISAALKVQATSDDAETLLRQAEEAAAGIPARIIEVAMVTARTDPARAEQIVRTITSGPEIVYVQEQAGRHERSATTGYMRSAEYWLARALADLATVSHEDALGHIRPYLRD